MSSCTHGSLAQTAYNYSTLKMEQLNRGVVAVKTADGKVAISWRKLRSDANDIAFNILRNGVILNSEPLTKGGTFFIDEKPLKDRDATYEVRCEKDEVRCEKDEVRGETFTLKTDAPIGYLPIPINKPEGRYSANDASVGDVDGDGQYEIFLKWEPWNAHDNSHDGYTDPVMIDCYRLDGTQLWRIDLGKNIRAGAHYTQFMVYDFDGDGRAEMMCRTADGTRDGEGTAIGNPNADWRNDVGRILTGPEYITVFEGMTGRAMDTKPYVPQRGDVSAWGDSRANRSDRFLAAVGYLGGMRNVASAIFCRGYYTRTVIAAWDWDGKELKQRWTFDTNTPEWAAYAGQGNHNLRVADVDSDGKDEIIYGSMTVDDDGTGLYNTGFGHGDALHLVVSPDDNRLYVWDCHENRRDGSELHDAATGKVVFQIKSSIDVGRCMAADIDPTNPGMEMWSIDSRGIWSMKGERIADMPWRMSINFGIWWDGDLLRELLDRETVTKYDWQQKQITVLQHFDDCQFNNGTKSNPCLSGDIIGDWREEVLTRNRESTELRLYVTTIPTDHRINCLMQDIPYRLSIATQNVAYNQPPEPGVFIGEMRSER